MAGSTRRYDPPHTVARPDRQITAGRESYTPRVTLGRRQACFGGAALFASLASAPSAGAAIAPASRRARSRSPAKSSRAAAGCSCRATARAPGVCSSSCTASAKPRAKRSGSAPGRIVTESARRYERLRKPPVRRTLSDAVYLTDTRLAELDRELERAPFRGFAIACPFTPNVFRAGPTAAVLDRYASVARGRRRARARA